MKARDVQTLLQLLLKFAELLPAGHADLVARLVGQLPALLVVSAPVWQELTEDLPDVRQATADSDSTARSLLAEVLALWRRERFEHERVLAEKNLKIGSRLSSIGLTSKIESKEGEKVHQRYQEQIDQLMQETAEHRVETTKMIERVDESD